MKRLEMTAVIMFWLALTGLLTACHDNSSPSNPVPEEIAQKLRAAFEAILNKYHLMFQGSK